MQLYQKSARPAGNIMGKVLDKIPAIGYDREDKYMRATLRFIPNGGGAAADSAQYSEKPRGTGRLGGMRFFVSVFFYAAPSFGQCG